jgi:GDP-L-fucose synthase
MKNYSEYRFIDAGIGADITIAEFAALIADIVGYRGRIDFDTSRPGGAAQKASRHIEARSTGMVC